jgi:hypothetical protein
MRLKFTLKNELSMLQEIRMNLQQNYITDSFLL